MPQFGKRGVVKVPDKSETIEEIVETPLTRPKDELGEEPEERRNQWLFPEDVVVRAEDAATLLMQFLPKETQQLIEEARQLRGVPLWQMLLGYVMRYAERYELFSPVILSAWESGGRADAPRPCKGCGDPFTSRFPEAAFCCNACACGRLRELGHSEGCPVVQFQRVGVHG